MAKSLRQGQHPVRRLLPEVSRAELWGGGTLINLGTPDQHKYIRGGWGSGWGPAISGKTHALEASRTAQLRVLERWGGCTRVVLRINSPQPKQQLKLSVDGAVVATRQVGEAWSELSFPLSGPLKPGRHTLDLSFSEGGTAGAPAARVDWVWLAVEGAKRPASGAKAGTRVFGGPRRALVADPPRRLSFYLEVPKRTALVFDYGASEPTDFELVLASDGARDRRLFRATARGSRWKEARVDLAPWAGKLVRLDFATRGEGGEAGWGEPDLMRRGPAPTVPAVTPQNRAKNLIYIVIDTARQDVFRAFDKRTRVETPAMDRLALESLLFLNAYANDNWTKPSVATALSGLYSSTHGTTRKSSVLPQTVRLLSQHLRAQGFDTAAFIANGYVSHKFGFKKGWRFYRNYIREDLPCEARQVYADALKWLSRPRQRRSFLYIQVIDPHVPYAVPSRYLRKYYQKRYRGRLGPSVSGYETQDWLDGKIQLTDNDRTYIRALYDGEVSYHDEHMGNFFAALEELERLDDTLVVVSNDHGEEMFDHGKIGHGHTLYDELLRCPLLLRYPRLLPRGRKSAEVVGLVDLTPTMLELLGQAPMPGMQGASLVDAAFGRSAPGGRYEVAEHHDHSRAVRLGPYKLIDSTRRTRLFHLADDPGERRDLSSSRPVARRACEVHLYEALAVPAKHQRLGGISQALRHQAPSVKIEGKLKRQLEALGYIK